MIYGPGEPIPDWFRLIRSQLRSDGSSRKEKKKITDCRSLQTTRQFSITDVEATSTKFP
jgi:hypothetical protein